MRIVNQIADSPAIIAIILSVLIVSVPSKLTRMRVLGGQFPEEKQGILHEKYILVSVMTSRAQCFQRRACPRGVPFAFSSRRPARNESPEETLPYVLSPQQTTLVLRRNLADVFLGFTDENRLHCPIPAARIRFGDKDELFGQAAKLHESVGC